MNDISASGISLNVTADKTFPNGFVFTEFADDADPFDLPSLDIAATAMNVNGDLVTWTAPQPVVPTINAIPGSDGDNNMAILFEANRAAKGKTVARDVITIVATYPDGSTVTLSNGKMTAGFPGKSVASAGRLKSKAYTFAFENISVTRATA
jgi:hypothetical protein